MEFFPSLLDALVSFLSSTGLVQAFLGLVLGFPGSVPIVSSCTLVSSGSIRISVWGLVSV